MPIFLPLWVYCDCSIIPCHNCPNVTYMWLLSRESFRAIFSLHFFPEVSVVPPCISGIRSNLRKNSNICKIDYNTQMELTIADWEVQEVKNFTQRSTLTRRYKEESGSIQNVNFKAHQSFINIQEVLIGHINILTLWGIPSTSRIVHNITEWTTS
jgi:hypothetical protein